MSRIIKKAPVPSTATTVIDSGLPSAQKIFNLIDSVLQCNPDGKHYSGWEAAWTAASKEVIDAMGIQLRGLRIQDLAPSLLGEFLNGEIKRELDPEEKAGIIVAAFKTLHRNGPLGNNLRNASYFRNQLLIPLLNHNSQLQVPGTKAPTPSTYGGFPRTAAAPTVPPRRQAAAPAVESVTTKDATKKQRSPHPGIPIPEVLHRAQPSEEAAPPPRITTTPSIPQPTTASPALVVPSLNAGNSTIDLAARLLEIDRLRVRGARSQAREELIKELRTLCKIPEGKLIAFGLANIKDIIGQLCLKDCKFEKVISDKPPNKNSELRFIYTIITNAIYEDHNTDLGQVLRSQSADNFVNNLQELAQRLLGASVIETVTPTTATTNDAAGPISTATDSSEGAQTQSETKIADATTSTTTSSDTPRAQIGTIISRQAKKADKLDELIREAQILSTAETLNLNTLKALVYKTIEKRYKSDETYKAFAEENALTLKPLKKGRKRRTEGWVEEIVAKATQEGGSRGIRYGRLNEIIYEITGRYYRSGAPLRNFAQRNGIPVRYSWDGDHRSVKLEDDILKPILAIVKPLSKNKLLTATRLNHEIQQRLGRRLNDIELDSFVEEHKLRLQEELETDTNNIFLRADADPTLNGSVYRKLCEAAGIRTQLTGQVPLSTEARSELLLKIVKETELSGSDVEALKNNDLKRALIFSVSSSSKDTDLSQLLRTEEGYQRFITRLGIREDLL